MNKLILNGQEITIEDIMNVVRGNLVVELGEHAIQKVQASSELVSSFVKEERIVYGITTGFGKFSDQYIAQRQVHDLQRNLIRSHACGVGEPYSKEVVRCMMLLRINSLLKGHSGITLATLQTLVAILNQQVIPYIPSQGSLGASGDLAPLAHMALVLIGEGQAYYQGTLVSGKEALQMAGIESVELQAKEGLALINGTQCLTAVGLITLYDALALADLAEVCLSFSMSALRGIVDAFDERVAAVRPHPGQVASSQFVRSLLQDNTFITRQNELRVQDAYSLRCASQVHGASRDALMHVLQKVEIEINSVTDNPLLFTESGDVISGGNFHGQALALAFDYLAIAISELANISERRLERLVNPALSNGLPSFLTKQGGLHSGFMIVQYSAASLVSENKVYSHPASVDSIPSSANQEDHVSMGNFAARKAQFVLKNAQKVLLMELLAALQGIDLRNEGNTYQLGSNLEQIYHMVRRQIPCIQEDVEMHPYLVKIEEMLPAIVAVMKTWRLETCN